jgi:hypothetical protein
VIGGTRKVREAIAGVPPNRVDIVGTVDGDADLVIRDRDVVTDLASLPRVATVG